jgi:hypothetical protein
MVEPAKRPTPNYGERLDELVAADDRSGAVKHFMHNAIGIAAPFVARMQLMPMWKGMKPVAHTLPYDWAALGRSNMYGTPLRAVCDGADSGRVRREEPGRAQERLAGAGRGAAERPAPRARGCQPQREDEQAGAGSGRVPCR